MAQLFRKILVPHDFSTHATRALRVAADLAAGHGGRLVVLHAIAPFSPVSGFPAVEEMVWIPPADLVGHERRRLETLVKRTVAARSGVRADVRVIIGDPFQQILEAARGANLIVMATAGRTGLSHLLIGSVAEKVVRHSPVPVLTLRPAAARIRRKTGRRRKGHRK
jgi:nucleotide-binding universal stress UspA family protein